MNRYRIWAVVLAWGLALAPGAAATDEPKSRAERQADQEELKELYCRDDQERPESWLDRSHSYISDRLCEPAAWFDGFFGDDRALEETPVGTFIRIRNAAEWDETRGWSHGLGIRASILLPRVSERVRLLVSRDDDLSGETRDGPSASDRNDRTRLGLRFIANEDSRSQLDFDGTVKIGSGGLNPELRGRYRYTQGLTARTLLRATQIGFWERREGFGTTSRLDWEWLPDRDRLIRWTGRGTLSEESDGVDWRTSATAFQQVSPRAALRGEIGVFGHTRPSFEVEEYFVAARYRRQFLRPWLYYELQPEYAWPLDELTGRRGTDWRFTFTLEIQFESEAHREQRLRDYLGDDEAEREDWDAEVGVPTDAPGDRARDPVLTNPEDRPEAPR